MNTIDELIIDAVLRWENDSSTNAEIGLSWVDGGEDRLRKDTDDIIFHDGYVEIIHSAMIGNKKDTTKVFIPSLEIEYITIYDKEELVE